jgi:hypothetical protein
MFWKVYAVIYLVLIAVGLPAALNRLPHMSPIDAIDMLLFTPIALMGLWSAAFRHISLPINTWKILLFGSVFWRAISVGNAILFGDVVPKFERAVAALSSQVQANASSTVTLAAMGVAFLVATFLTLPPLIALYRNAYGDESLLKLMAPSRMRSSHTVA